MSTSALSDDEVVAIRMISLLGGVSQGEIARTLDMTQPYVSSVASRALRNNVPPTPQERALMLLAEANTIRARELLEWLRTKAAARRDAVAALKRNLEADMAQLQEIDP